jgi:hypothetical protein
MEYNRMDLVFEDSSDGTAGWFSIVVAIDCLDKVIAQLSNVTDCFAIS